MICYYCDKCGSVLDKDCNLIVSFHQPDKPSKKKGFFGHPEHAKRDFYLCPRCWVNVWQVMNLVEQRIATDK